MDTLYKTPALKVLIVDDHYLLRHGLKAMLLSFRKALPLEIHEAASGEKALQYLNHTTVDLVIMDCKLEGISGVETTLRLLRFRPEIKVLALSHYNDYPLISSMMDAGAKGFILKSVEPEQLLLAIKTLLAGKKFYCNEVALVMIDAVEDGPRKLVHLTPRELEVLALIVAGLTNGVIAKKLFLNRRTVDTHRQNLLKKMKVTNTAALVRLAIEMQLLP